MSCECNATLQLAERTRDQLVDKSCSPSANRNMTWHCYIFAFLALAFSACFQQGLASAINVTADIRINRMNTSANPCEDFNEFACGRFIKELEPGTGSVLRSSIAEVKKQKGVILTNIILEESSPSHPKYRLKMKQFYQSCMDEAQIDVVGVAPYFKDRKFIDDWPTINPSWTGANFDLNEVIARYMPANIQPIFVISVSIDPNDTAKNVIQLSHGRVEMDHGGQRNDARVMAYQKYIAETAIALNASREVAEKDARDVVDLEIELAKIYDSMQVTPVSLRDLNSVTDKLDIARAMRATFDIANIALADNERIINLYPTYMKNLPSVLGRFSNRTIQNMFGFQYALLRVGGLTRKLAEIQLGYRTAILGDPTLPPRQVICFHKTAYAFSKGSSKQFVLRHFPQTAKVYFKKMIDNLIKEFRGMIEEAKWMSNQTKVKAFAKLASMKLYIGYPDEDFEEADIEKFYENYTMNEKEYYNNFVILVNQHRLQQLKTLRQPSSKNLWPIPPYELYAGYDMFQNALTFPAGILQPPLFSESYQQYLNYGLMGFIIGKDITHGFDDTGSHIDKDGNLRNWWTEDDHHNFNNRTQCIMDQNSRIKVVEVNMTVNGLNTRAKTLIDRSGLKVSFRAYQRGVKQNGVEPTLTGLNLTQDQLFFLSFGQLLCEKFTPEALKNELASGDQLPGKYRINGILQNSVEFAKAYNCTLGSFMNPAEKCSVW